MEAMKVEEQSIGQFGLFIARRISAATVSPIPSKSGTTTCGNGLFLDSRFHGRRFQFVDELFEKLPEARRPDGVSDDPPGR